MGPHTILCIHCEPLERHASWPHTTETFLVQPHRRATRRYRNHILTHWKNYSRIDHQQKVLVNLVKLHTQNLCIPRFNTQSSCLKNETISQPLTRTWDTLLAAGPFNCMHDHCYSLAGKNLHHVRNSRHCLTNIPSRPTKFQSTIPSHSNTTQGRNLRAIGKCHGNRAPTNFDRL